MDSPWDVCFCFGASRLEVPVLLCPLELDDGSTHNRLLGLLCVPSSPALSQMGYNLSPQFTQLLVSRYCPRSANPAMQLDRFIQVCTQLQVLTEAFREKDTAVQGNIRLSFEDFVTMTASRML